MKAGKKMGSSKNRFLDFRVSLPDIGNIFINISLRKLKHFQKYFGDLLWGLGPFDSCNKLGIKNLMLVSLLVDMVLLVGI